MFGGRKASVRGVERMEANEVGDGEELHGRHCYDERRRLDHHREQLVHVFPLCKEPKREE